jgi:hypothetical protein
MSVNCVNVILEGIAKDCSNLNAAIGAEKDLILVNYEDFDKAGTALIANREIDDLGNNIGGLTAIKLKLGAIQHVFEGTDYSVVPSVTPEIKEDGDAWYIHSIGFTVYSKKAKDRKTLEALGYSKVIAITKDRSTGLYELFGGDQGLKMSGIERAYVGTQNSNFYAVTIATSDIGVVRESTLGELSTSIITALV